VLLLSGSTAVAQELKAKDERTMLSLLARKASAKSRWHFYLSGHQGAAEHIRIREPVTGNNIAGELHLPTVR